VSGGPRSPAYGTEISVPHSSVLGLQRAGGNTAITRALTGTGRVTLQRLPGPSSPKAWAYTAHPAALADCVSVLSRLYQVVRIGVLD
jgi:hypothetical protein